MSVNTPKQIIELKRNAKVLEEQASVYAIGFDTPAKKKPSDQSIVFAVGKNFYRRHSQFIESGPLESNEVQSKETQENQNTQKIESIENADLNKKKNVAAQKGTQFSPHNTTDLVVLNSTQTHKSISENIIVDKYSIQFPLDAGRSDDLTLIQSEIFGSCTESLLFRNNYFKVIKQQDNSVDAMCLICGYDENNKPKLICKAQKNVSSNFISHLKVKYKIEIEIRFFLLLPHFYID